MDKKFGGKTSNWRVHNKDREKSSEALSEALEAYKNAGGFGADGKVAKYDTGAYVVDMKPYYEKYGVNRNTFSRAVNQKVKDTKFKPLFSDDEEKILVNFVKLRELLGYPMTRQGLQQFAKEFREVKHQKKINEETDPTILDKLRAKEINEPSRSWANNFLQRYQDELAAKEADKEGEPQSREVLYDFDEIVGQIFSCIDLSFGEEVIAYLRKLVYNSDETDISKKPKEVVFVLPECSDPLVHFVTKKMEKTLAILTNPKPLISDRKTKYVKQRGRQYAIVLTTPKRTPLETASTSQSIPAVKKKRRAQFTEVLPGNYDNFCDKCLNRGPKSGSLWVICGGGCSRWYHHLCVPELSEINNIAEEMKKTKWFCPTCDKWGPFCEYTHSSVE